jgi:hypothetical protein
LAPFAHCEHAAFDVPSGFPGMAAALGQDAQFTAATSGMNAKATVAIARTARAIEDALTWTGKA